MTPASPKTLFSVRVHSITDLAEDIRAFELVDPKGRDLAAFAAGAHIDVHIDDGLVRQYSLCNSPQERHRYGIAVLNEPDGRGGSQALCEKVSEGDTLTVSEPRNHFRLVDGADHYLLLAGGIGVTPMMAMIETLESVGADYVMHYCTRAPINTAFLDRLIPLVEQGKVFFHHDGGDPSQGLDIESTLINPVAGTHLYYCGPTGFMSAVAAAADHWPKGTVHFEYFTSPEENRDETLENKPFQVKVASTGDVFDIPADKTIIEVLRGSGLTIDTSCEDGYCATCITRYLEGKPEHRDGVLDDEDRAEFVLICCARSRTPLLVLDL
ncbi:MAG: PDR/VanB family oxidoreductase [Proteobacteria bacterium]|nr:PDR/VanB family oxidoreductase [Pseudomonadota bacterium]